MPASPGDSEHSLYMCPTAAKPGAVMHPPLQQKPQAMVESHAVRGCPAVDGMRVFAAFAVICLHTDPFYAERLEDPTTWTAPLAWCINLLALFAVPYFFIVSGYFFGQRLLAPDGSFKTSALSKIIRRILPMYLGWCLFYALMPRPRAWHQLGWWGAIHKNLHDLLGDAVNHPWHLLFNGTGLQLWFLASLCLAATMAFVILRWRPKWLYPTAVAMFVCGLLGQGYGQLFGIDLLAQWNVNTRLGPFFGFPLFTLGIWQSRQLPPKSRQSLLLALIALGILFAEGVALSALSDRYLAHYYVGSALTGLGLFRIALANPTLFGMGILPQIGVLTPGIYVTHTYLLSVFEQLPDLPLETLPGQILLPLALFALSLLCAYALANTPVLRRLV